jgi:hypothetical protein
MARYKTATDIISQVAVEVGLRSTADPFAESDPAYQQMIALLSSAGMELIEEAEWGTMRREEKFTTDTATNPQGIYDLPDNFAYMIDQTSWERTQNVPLFGPASPQYWAYLLGRNLVSSTIYAQFRLTEGKLYLFPQPPPDGLEISYEYISDSWVNTVGIAGAYSNVVTNPADVILYPFLLIQRLLKLRFLEARGFDTQRASSEYSLSLESWKGKDKGAPILNAGGAGYVYPLLDPYRNTPDRGYGS